MLQICSRWCDPVPDPTFHANLYPTLIRIWIVLRIKVRRICTHGSQDPQWLHFKTPRLHCERPRLFMAPFWASIAPKFWLCCDSGRTGVAHWFRGHREMSTILAGQYRPLIWAQIKGDGGEVGCGVSANKHSCEHGAEIKFGQEI